MHLRNGEKRLSIGGENRVFHIKVTLPNLRHPQFTTEDNFFNFYGGNLFGNLQTILPTWFTFSKHSSFLHNVNYLKKYERQSDVERR